MFIQANTTKYNKHTGWIDSLFNLNIVFISTVVFKITAFIYVILSIIYNKQYKLIYINSIKVNINK